MLNKVTINIGEDSEVLAEIINGYQINLRFTISPKIICNASEILSLMVGKGGLSLFDKLKVPIDHKIISSYEVNKIEKITDKSFSIYATIGTKTKQFILPCLEFDREYFLYDTFLENAYIKVLIRGDNTSDWSKFPLILLYRYSESEIYRNFETRITKHPLFKFSIDINPFEVLYVFNIKDYEKDLNKFINGKYSELSNKLKLNIMSFHSYSKDGLMWKILNKDVRLKEQLEIKFETSLSKTMELYDIPDINKETYTLNN